MRNVRAHRSPDCTRPLIGIGVNEYHPSMAQSLKTKYLLLALGSGAGLRCCLGGFAYYEHRIDSADIAQLTYATVEQKLEGDLEARAQQRGQHHRRAARPRVGCAQQRGHRLDRRTPARGATTSSASRSRMRAAWCCSAASNPRDRRAVERRRAVAATRSRWWSPTASGPALRRRRSARARSRSG